MNYYVEALKKYSDFGGRAMRVEYWTFYLVNFAVSLGISIIGALSGGGAAAALNMVGWIYSLAVLVPGVAVTVRRLHDTNHSGWWTLIVFVPLIGVIILLIWVLTDSQPGANQYGPNPKQPAKPATA